MAAAKLFIADATARHPIAISDKPIAEGLTGFVHTVANAPGTVVKLYKEPKDLAEYREKVAAMVAAPPNLPPINENGRSFVQIAWPKAPVITERDEFRGFSMPMIDWQASANLDNILQKSARQAHKLPEGYHFRVLLARNLASVMQELHTLGHYMVDMKPLNMRFYPASGYMAILDTDGFSIKGAKRFPARQFSDEYIAPEAGGRLPDTLGSEQDQFALAVILFRMLNNGIHPFQGIDAVSSYPSNLQERIFKGLYAYGRRPRRDVQPTKWSLHEYLEDSTRELFDRAFEGQPKARPSAKEWRDHLTQMFERNILVKCRVNPDHAHFSKGCGLCALDQKLAKARTAVPAAPPVQASASMLQSIPTAPPPPARPTPIPAPIPTTMIPVTVPTAPPPRQAPIATPQAPPQPLPRPAQAATPAAAAGVNPIPTPPIKRGGGVLRFLAVLVGIGIAIAGVIFLLNKVLGPEPSAPTAPQPPAHAPTPPPIVAPPKPLPAPPPAAHAPGPPIKPKPKPEPEPDFGAAKPTPKPEPPPQRQVQPPAAPSDDDLPKWGDEPAGPTRGGDDFSAPQSDRHGAAEPAPAPGGGNPLLRAAIMGAFKVKVGGTVSWTDAVTGRSGFVLAQRQGVDGTGTLCRQVSVVQMEPVQVTSSPIVGCKQWDGGWRIVFSGTGGDAPDFASSSADPDAGGPDRHR